MKYFVELQSLFLWTDEIKFKELERLMVCLLKWDVSPQQLAKAVKNFCKDDLNKFACIDTWIHLSSTWILLLNKVTKIETN